MRGLKAGITGFAMAGGAALAPQQALATAAFDISANLLLGVQSLDSGPGNAFVQQVFTPYQAELLAELGSTSYSEGSTDFNTAFGWTPQSGGSAVDLTTLNDLQFLDNVLGGFQVSFAGVANTIPQAESDVWAVGVAPDFGTPGSQVYDFFSEIETEMTLSVVPAIMISELSADPGDTANTGGRYLIDDLETDGIEFIVQVEASVGEDPMATLIDIDGNESELIIGSDGEITLADGSFLGLDLVLGPRTQTWAFSYEGFGRAITDPGPPEAEVPVPAALPLLATAMGGLFWMKRRRKA
ncbi:MAG: VPLPA-CTERM sorting domain-containing protein [Pseudomonadota bacterium]